MRASDFFEGTLKLTGFNNRVDANAPAVKFRRAVEELVSLNPLNDHQYVYRNVAVFELRRDVDDPNGAVELGDIRAIVKGGGAQAMTMLCELADKFGVKITLYAKGYAHVPTAKLYEYYQRFGFKSEYEMHPEDMKYDGVEMERLPR